MRIGIVTSTSLENFPVITIVPRNGPIACTTAYLTFEQLGAGHYDAVIKSNVETTLADDKTSSNGTQQDNLDHSEPHNYHIACRCHQGAAENKQVRKFYTEFKSSCKCFRSLKGCTVMCSCRNCANLYGFRIQAENEMSSGTQEQKRHKHMKSPETGRNFFMGRGRNTFHARALFEELLCGECALHLGETEETSKKDVTSLYNKLHVVVLIKKNSVHLPKDELMNSELAKIEEKDALAVERFSTRQYKENENFKDETTN